MPDFTFRGASGGESPGLYPMLRDSYGVLVGTARPGDIARFEEAPDVDWVPYESGGDTVGGTPGSTPETAGTGTQDQAGSEQGNDDQAGASGSEEN